MKTIIKNILLVSAMALPLASCSDFLDKEPLDKGTEAIVFKTPQQFEQPMHSIIQRDGKTMRIKPITATWTVGSIFQD